jgi:hypothetical protein
MLEKVMGVKLINKLHAILLMEADFNAANKIIYGERMLDNVHYDRETSEFTWNSGTPRQLPGWSFWGHKELALEFPWNLTISNYLIRPNQLNSRVRMPGEFQD